MNHDRRAILTAFGLAVPFGLDRLASAAPLLTGGAVSLTLRSFEDGVREAFRLFESPGAPAWRRVPVGHGPAVEAGLQGCVNDRPFAGFMPGCLRIVRTGTEPGPTIGGVRLYLATVDLVRNDPTAPGRPFDFASLPPAPVLVGGEPDPVRPTPRRSVGSL